MDALRDDNRITQMMGISSVDGVTPTPVVIDSVTNRVNLKQESLAPVPNVTNRGLAARDGNRVPSMIGTSSADDGTLVVVVLQDNNLRINQV